ncbi:MAG: hypothetical protein U5K69_05770 [Balneolaceae bacterium]|nr:hypothetical protein [Balneolaceae bacterium]
MVPSPQQFQPQTEYFDNNTSSKGQTVQAGEAYQNASLLVKGTVRPLFSTSQVYMSFLENGQQQDANYTDGEWVWSYSASQSGQTAEIQLTAQTNQTSEDVSWALMLSTETPSGPDFDNYQFMTGTTSHNAEEGTWNIFPYEPGSSPSPIVTYEWANQEGESYQASYTISPPDETETFIINYSKMEMEHSLSFRTQDGETEVVIAWNTDTGTGYINRAGEDRVCWDENLETVPCQ